MPIVVDAPETAKEDEPESGLAVPLDITDTVV